MNTPDYPRVAGAVALTLWISSLILPAVTMCSPNPSFPIPSWPGWHILLLGWLGPLIGQFGWFANLTMIWISFRLIFQHPAGIAPGLAGLCLALTSFSWTGIHGVDSPATICQHNSGFFIWIACAVFLCAIAFIQLISTSSTAKEPVEVLPLSNDAPPHHSQSDAT